MTLAERVQARINDLVAERDATIGELEELASNPEARGLTDEQALEQVAELRTKGEKLNDDIAKAKEQLASLAVDEQRRAEAAAAVAPFVPTGGAVVRSEPKTYTAENRERSFFVDAYRAERYNDLEARSRIERHTREIEAEYRDITTSTLNGLVPPVYLLDQAAALARGMRPLADIFPKIPLPATGMTMYATKVLTGTATAVQTSQNTAVMEQDVVTTDISIPVVTVGGVQDISRQALERGAVTDSLIMADLVAAYATNLDTQLISGTGANGQMTGVLTTSATTASWTGTTVASFYSKFVGMLSTVAGARYAPATIAIMHPRRWHWLLAQSDTAGRPLVVPNPGANMNPVGTGGSAVVAIGGTLAGIPVLVDANVSITSGASSNEDRVIVTKLNDHFLAESSLNTFAFEQYITPPTTVRLAVWGYAAATWERYLTATAIMVGTGLVAPTF